MTRRDLESLLGGGYSGPDPTIWRSAEGDIPIKNMGNRHLINALSVLERRVPDSVLEQAPVSEDPPGLDAQPTTIQRAERRMAAVLYPQYKYLLQEAVDRGLLVDTENILATQILDPFGDSKVNPKAPPLNEMKRVPGRRRIRFEDEEKEKET